MEKKKKSALDELLSEITAEEQSRIDSKMLLAAKIADAMKKKGWNKTMLMEAMGKRNPSEITRWLSGTHNFTADTLEKLQHKLGVKLLNVELEDNYAIEEQKYYTSIETDKSSSWASFSSIFEQEYPLCY